MPPQYNVDGYERPLEDEIDINRAFAQTFTGEPGQAVLQYLKDISINVVVPPDNQDNHLWMQEGMRNLARIIHTRHEDGIAGRPAPQEEKTDG